MKSSKSVNKKKGLNLSPHTKKALEKNNLPLDESLTEHTRQQLREKGLSELALDEIDEELHRERK